MSTEAQTTDNKATATTTETAVAAPKVEAPPAAKAADPKPEAAPKAAQVQESRPTTAKRIGADEDLPEDADLLELSPRALASRIARATKKELKERFGTDDPDEIKAKLARADELEAKEEERKLAEMTEKERLEAELAKERERASAAETKYAKAEEARVVETTTKKVIDIALKFVDADYAEDALAALKRDMRANWDDSELENETKAYKKMETFFKEYIEKKPKMAKDFQVTQEVKATPLNSGIGNARPQGAPQNLMGSKSGGEKDVKNMSKQEYIQWKRQRGIST